jgi:hypothetical protein
VTEPGGGEITTVGPAHFDLRATTSANRVRSAKDTFGCDFNWRQASLVGMVSAGLPPSWEALGGEEACVLSLSLSLYLVPLARGQSAHGPLQARDSPTAAQNACPNTSSAHARQFDGSPEQPTAGPDCVTCEGLPEEGTMGNNDLRGRTSGRRRRGTGGWYGGRLSRIDCAPIWETGGNSTGTMEAADTVVVSVLNGVAGGLRTISRQTQEVQSVQRPHSKAPMAWVPLYAEDLGPGGKLNIVSRVETGDGNMTSA